MVMYWGEKNRRIMEVTAKVHKEIFSNDALGYRRANR
jgi:hypothetical protein